MSPLWSTLALAYALLASLVFVRKDREEYGRFKLIEDPAERLVYFRRWVGRSFVVFGLSALVILASFGKLDALVGFPVELEGVRASLPYQTITPPSGAVSPAFLLGFFMSGLLGAMVVFVILSVQGGGLPVLGDVEAVIPRNAAERRWALLLSVNAGVSEELFFRLLLPLLITVLSGNALAGFVSSILLFGFFHAYQGWAGVLATTFVGLVLTVLYIASSSLFAVIVLHAGMDILNLVVRPWLTQQIAIKRHRRGGGTS